MYVGNLGPKITRDIIEDRFREFGKIKNIEISKDPKTRFESKISIYAFTLYFFDTYVYIYIEIVEVLHLLFMNKLAPLKVP